jgi:hypothetical protein
MYRIVIVTLHIKIGPSWVCRSVVCYVGRPSSVRTSSRLLHCHNEALSLESMSMFSHKMRTKIIVPVGLIEQFASVRYNVPSDAVHIQ